MFHHPSSKRSVSNTSVTHHQLCAMDHSLTPVTCNWHQSHTIPTGASGVASGAFIFLFLSNVLALPLCPCRFSFRLDLFKSVFLLSSSFCSPSLALSLFLCFFLLEKTAAATLSEQKERHKQSTETTDKKKKQLPLQTVTHLTSCHPSSRRAAGNNSGRAARPLFLRQPNSLERKASQCF